jgi:hypothetical protein
VLAQPSPIPEKPLNENDAQKYNESLENNTSVPKPAVEIIIIRIPTSKMVFRPNLESN